MRRVAQPVHSGCAGVDRPEPLKTQHEQHSQAGPFGAQGSVGGWVSMSRAARKVASRLRLQDSGVWLRGSSPGCSPAREDP